MTNELLTNTELMLEIKRGLDYIMGILFCIFIMVTCMCFK